LLKEEHSPNHGKKRKNGEIFAAKLKDKRERKEGRKEGRK
jgi:hypothetical protein